MMRQSCHTPRARALQGAHCAIRHARRIRRALAALPALLALLAPAATAAQAQAFQNVANYRIEAKLDDATGVLTGRAELRYANHAPAALDTLWFHEYLNAFRPNSLWARKDLQRDPPIRTYQDIGPDDYGFQRLGAVTVDGTAVRPVYTLAPDSTVFALPLPRPLASGAIAVVRMDWAARLSTAVRRQGRKGRHFDWAHWFPRIAVYRPDGWEYNPLTRQGEFNGEYGSFDVTQDVAADQVIAATGIPVSGDPGWAQARVEGSGPVTYARSAYTVAPPESLGLLIGSPAPGRKRIRWVANVVHNFVWNASPTYQYAEGSAAGVPVHVFYEPADSVDMGDVVQVGDTALDWLAGFMGGYPWPQWSIVRRVEGGGTEFPMLIMVGRPSLGLFVHEGSHQWFSQILGNNEWRSGWLDEGFATFLTNWFAEDQGRTPEQVWGRSMRGMVALENAGRAEPIATPGPDFSSFRIYNAMIYTKTSIVLRMLRYLVGRDTMHQILRTFYHRYAFKHTTESDFRKTVADVAGEDYGWFFDEWIHTTDQLDYAVGEVRTTRLDDGRWQTRVQVLRHGKAWMPVVLEVAGQRQTLTGHDPQQTVTVTTAARPDQVTLDPDHVLLDIHPENNTRAVAAP
ncbi:MAG TPA: M1 family metallopeptidase [Longimicrobiales bacterium]|nr:M1 family metallopeptidase [Longimicrobiales bacterium]